MDEHVGNQIRRVVYSQEEIQARVRDLGREITRAYGPGDDLLVVGLLKGAFVFMADLIRAIERPLKVDFLVVSSYGDGTESSGEVRVHYGAAIDLRDRHVLLVEDIVDSGTTLNRLIPDLEARKPRSLEICTLLHKRIVTLDREPRWVGFDCPREFVVGYGLDHAEDYRHLPYIGSL